MAGLPGEMKHPTVERRFMPNDRGKLKKAFVKIHGNHDFRVDENILIDILEAICDYEDEKYLETGKGIGADYTKDKLLRLLDYRFHSAYPEHDEKLYREWLERVDPNNVMGQRDGWKNSISKLDVTNDSNGWVAITLTRRASGFFPSFADLWRILHACGSIWGYERLYEIVQRA